MCNQKWHLQARLIQRSVLILLLAVEVNVKLKDVPYPLRLCVEMLYYCFLTNKKTEHMKASEIKDSLLVFFTDEQIDEAQKVLTGDVEY